MNLDYLETREYKIFCQIQELKQQLADWEYKTSKYTDGEYTEEEWAEIKAQRKQWREQIRQLEKELEENDNNEE